jgi:hypothetical protein
MKEIYRGAIMQTFSLEFYSQGLSNCMTSGLVVRVPGYRSGDSVLFPALPDFLRRGGPGTGSTQLCEDNLGANWMKKCRLLCRKPRLKGVRTRCADHAIPPYPQKLTLTSPTSGGRVVGTVRLRIKSHGVYMTCARSGKWDHFVWTWLWLLN